MIYKFTLNNCEFLVEIASPKKFDTSLDRSVAMYNGQTLLNGQVISDRYKEQQDVLLLRVYQVR